MSDETTQGYKFGNWLSSQPARIAGLSIFGWGCLLVSVLLMVASFLLGRFAAGLWSLLLGLIVTVIFFVPFGSKDAGRTIVARLYDRIGSTNRTFAGGSQYRTGIFSNLPAGQLNALPGALSNVDEIDGIDGTGMPYTLLHHKSAKLLAATMSCVPDGTDMLPQETINNQVSTFGGWIAGLSRDDAIAGATITVDGSYSSKEPLVAKLESEQASWAPQVALDHFNEATMLLPDKFTQTSVHASVVWGVKNLGATVEDAVAEVASKLPTHRDLLYASGGGLPVTATSEELAKIVQIAYNPYRATEYGTEGLLGLENPMKLSEAGPQYFDDFPGRIALHDGVASITAQMTIPPRIHITDTTFKELFAPQEKFLRKRVTIFYRPLGTDQAISKAEQLRRNTNVTATSKAQQSSFDQHKVDLAKKTETDLVAGASMTCFALMVTVTFEPNQQAYREAKHKLQTLLGATNLGYRWVDHGASAAFHSTLPLGILPWAYQGVVDHVAEGL